MAPVLISILLTAAQMTLAPVPREVSVDGRDVFRLSPLDPIVVPDSRTAERDTAVALLRKASGFDLPVVTADRHRRGARGLYIGETGTHEHVRTRQPGSLMRAPAPAAPPAQGYTLRVTRDTVVLLGADPAGTFHGVQTLSQLIGERGEIPCVTITDAPDLPWRGAWLEGKPPTDVLDALAAIKCNLAVFESDDFLELTPERLRDWREVFEQARRRHIEPVPVVRTVTNVAALLERHPEAALARTVTERVRLEEDHWALLPHPNVLETPETPITVSLGGRAFAAGRDYAVDSGRLAYPYVATNMPWLIRRNIGGAIPDGAVVSVTYAYVPEGTTACFPLAQAVEDAWLHTLETLARELAPRFIVARHDWPSAIQSDPRFAAFGEGNAQLLGDSVRTLDKLARRANPELRLVVASDAFRGSGQGTEEIIKTLPRSAAYIVQPGTVARDPATMLGSWLSADHEVFGMPLPSPRSTYAWGNALTAAQGRVRGMLAPLKSDTGSDTAFRIAMQKAWAAEKWRAAWPEVFNAYFDADLWDPGYVEVLEVLAAHIDRQTLAGVPPDKIRNEFLDYQRQMRSRLPADDPQAKRVADLIANMTEYLELERAFTRDQSPSVLRRLVNLVERQTGDDPRADETRTQRILEPIESRGLFVPSSILFGVYLLPFREMPVMAGHRPLEILAEPVYKDTEHTAQATYNFLAEPGPICRVDFDTVGAATVTLERSRDGQTFTTVHRMTSRERGGVRAPAILERPVSTRYLRITAEAPAEQAVLRNPRVFALKGPAVGVCGRSDAAPILDASFTEGCWPLEPQVDGFVLRNGRAFAQAQTTCWLCVAQDTLYIAVYAREPRMATMAASAKDRDASLEGDEHFEITVETPGGTVFTFAVNPLGTQFDSRDGDSGWRGDWQVATASYDEGWAAEFGIPFKVFGQQPRRSEAWRMNFTRFRNNVHKEHSSWAYDPKTGRVSEWGNMIFN